ncbi:hypothetical protein PG993_012270 [Apiospora rasikravindrae]|uniref:Uncharacterized protein n=1 Tax=Apiospora rasikravindrae TaxID=990691 RepID=A0ABR1S1Y8_9PEZI
MPDADPFPHDANATWAKHFLQQTTAEDRSHVSLRNVMPCAPKVAQGLVCRSEEDSILPWYLSIMGSWIIEALQPDDYVRVQMHGMREEEEED